MTPLVRLARALAALLLLVTAVSLAAQDDAAELARLVDQLAEEA